MKKIAVIGSGYSGLTCAALLSKKGYAVELYEKHTSSGGYGDSFKNKGFTFHPSIYRFSSIIYSLLEETLGLSYKEFIHYYTEYHFPNREIVMDDEIMVVMTREFPHLSKNIEHFSEKMNEIASILDSIEQNGGSIFNLSVAELKKYIQFSKKTINEILTEYFGIENHFKEVLCAWLDLTEDMSAITIPVTMVSIKEIGENKMVPGGGRRVVEDIQQILFENGGMFFPRQSISEATIVNDQLIALKAASGKQITDFDYVVWANDYSNFYQLKGSQNLWNKDIETDFTPSSSNFSVWLGINQPFEDLGIKELSHSIYIGDQTFYSKHAKKNIPIESDFLMVSFLYSKDAKSTPDKKTQICAGSALNFDFMKACKEQGIYREVKKELEEIVLTILKKTFPSIAIEQTICKVSATPLTYERYTKNRKGSMYGFEKTQEFVVSTQRHSNVHPAVNNLLFCSQWTSVAGGTYGAITEGIKVANQILKRENDEAYSYQG